MWPASSFSPSTSSTTPGHTLRLSSKKRKAEKTSTFEVCVFVLKKPKNEEFVITDEDP